jgi:DNA-binding transcriptional ArsR family regulator
LALTDDITDPRLAKALAHPLRIEILRALGDRTASPSEIAAEVGAPLTNVSYHVRKLRALGLIKLVRKTPKRGVVEHYYSAPARQTVSDEAWAQTPTVVKNALAEAMARQAAGALVQASTSGGFDRKDAHLTRTPMKLDERGWKQISKVLQKALADIDKLAAQAGARLADGATGDRVDAHATIALFQTSPPADQPATDSPSASARGSRGRRKTAS